MTARHPEGAAHAVTYHAEAYSKFRPTPPISLISRIVNFLQEKYSGPLNSAVDVGCGTGQSTSPLGKYFNSVSGFDISQAQIKEAILKNSLSNVSFKVNPAENLPFENESIQLITAGQACHWFDLPKFYQEADRVLDQNGVLALYSYHFPQPIWKEDNKDLHNILISVYHNDIEEKYWGKERLYVENNYTDSIFDIPFDELVREDNFILETKATVKDLEGYITSWSGFQKYKSENGEAAAQKILDNYVKKTMEAIGEDAKPQEIELTLRYNFFLIMGRKV